MIVRIAEPRDFPSIVSLINSVFGLDRDIEWFTWFHQQNPAGSSILWVAENEAHEVVSYRSIVFFLGHLGTDDLVVGQFADACTRPDYRGQGIYGEVNRAAINDFFSRGGDLIMAFPGVQNYEILTHKFGFREVPGFGHAIYPLPGLSKAVGLGGPIVRGAIGLHSAIFARRVSKTPLTCKLAPALDMLEHIHFYSRTDRIHLDRSPGYMRWRCNTPGRPYYVIRLNEDNFMVLGEARRRGMKVCTIVDERHSSRKNLHVMVRELSEWASLQKSDAVFTWRTTFSGQGVQNGFISVPSKTRLLVKPRSGFEAAQLPMFAQRWTLSLLDTDAY